MTAKQMDRELDYAPKYKTDVYLFCDVTANIDP
jgi:hypothetical protein